MSEFTIKDSGERQQFDSGMVRDTEDGKTDYSSVMYGPMYRRWAEHTTKGRAKYPDPDHGIPNWTLAQGVTEYLRARSSFLRHQAAYLRGDVDEDHAAAIFFNVNLMEYAREHVERQGGTVPFVFERKPVLTVRKPTETLKILRDGLNQTRPVGPGFGNHA